MALRTISICAGIGGIDLGLCKHMGREYRTVCYIEREAYAAAVLAHRMQKGTLCDAPIWSDVATFDPEPWRGRVDCITAGYPCQPFSCAGQRKGEADPRHLWPHIARIIAELRPKQCFFENVTGHITLGLESVATDLQAMGYDVSAGVFSAAQVGAPHVRKRLFILANSQMQGLPHSVGQRAAPVSGLEHCGKEMANSDRARQLQPQGSESAQRRWLGNGGAASRSFWAIEPFVGRVANGIPHRVDRLRALGNAVVPATAQLAWRTLNG